MNKGVLAVVIFTTRHRACARRQWQLQREGRQACKQEQYGYDGNIDEDVPSHVAHDGTATAVVGVLLGYCGIHHVFLEYCAIIVLSLPGLCRRSASAVQGPCLPCLVCLISHCIVIGLLASTRNREQ